MSKKVLYITTSLFPDGQAYSTRVVNFGRLLKRMDYEVHVIAERTLVDEIDRNKIYEFENFTYEIIGNETRKYRYINKKKCLSAALMRAIKNEKVAFAILNIDMVDSYEKVRKICLENGIKVIRETCEWYDKSSYKLGVLDPRYILMQTYTRQDLYRADGVITISRLLSGHYKSCDNTVIRIPTILDIRSRSFNEKTENNKIRLIHAGSRVGKDHKEQLENILIALSTFGEDNPFELYIYGSERADVLQNISADKGKTLLSELGDVVNIMGKIPQHKVHEAYMESDFSIFIRPNRLSSNAGFPTKFAESMAAGTPVIANDTGDVGVYLNDNVNGLYLNDVTVESIRSKLLSILVFDKEKHISMRKNARKTAEKYFDYRSYCSSMDKFITQIME